MAETVYRQRRRVALDVCGPDGVREAATVRDAAFSRCIDASAAAVQPALFDVPEQQAVVS